MIKLTRCLLLLCVFHGCLIAQETELPYRGSAYKFQSTIGQLCKLSQFVALADVQAIRRDDGVGNFRLDLRIVQVLHGSATQGTVQLLCGARSKPSVTSGQRCLVFASRKDFPFPVVNPLRWDFDEATIEQAQGAQLSLLGGKRGIISVDADGQDILASTVEQYLDHLRGDTRSADLYVKFLRSLSAHSLRRVRQDAEADLMACVRYQSVDFLRGLLTDDHLDARMKDYTHHILEWKLHGMNAPSNQVVRTSEGDLTKVKRVQALLSSSGRSEKLQGFVEISHGKKGWSEQHRSAWIEQAAACLADPDPDVRLSAASAMSAAGDKRAVPLLIRGLDHENIAYRAIMWKNLKAITGNGIPEYDPQVSSEDRKKSISEVREWCSKYVLPEKAVGIAPKKKL